jgi:hypothetical protein
MSSEALDMAGVTQATWRLDGTPGRHSGRSGQAANSAVGIRPH